MQLKFLDSLGKPVSKVVTHWVSFKRRQRARGFPVYNILVSILYFKWRETKAHALVTWISYKVGVCWASRVTAEPVMTFKTR